MAPPLDTSTREQILGMLRADCSVNKIVTKLGCHRSTVFRLRARAEKRKGDVATKTGCGRKATVVTKRFIDNIRKKVQRDPTRSERSMAREYEVSLWSVQKAVAKAGFRSASRLVVHDIMPGQQVRRLERARLLLEWRARPGNMNRPIIWSDEKLFLVQQHLNKRNNRVLIPVLAVDNTLRIIRKRKNPAKGMVFGAVASDGHVMKPIIFPSTMNINSINYQQLVLTKVKEWIRETWGPEQEQSPIFMQNGAPAHTSKSTQEWLAKNLGENNFWKKELWPPSSPDCNPMDFSIWAKLVSAVCKKEPKNRDHLVQRIEGMWLDLLDVDYVTKTCSAAWDRLRRVVEAEGDYIEAV